MISFEDQYWRTFVKFDDGTVAVKLLELSNVIYDIRSRLEEASRLLMYNDLTSGEVEQVLSECFEDIELLTSVDVRRP